MGSKTEVVGGVKGVMNWTYSQHQCHEESENLQLWMMVELRATCFPD